LKIIKQDKRKLGEKYLPPKSGYRFLKKFTVKRRERKAKK
jgi:hypothetical protein